MLQSLPKKTGDVRRKHVVVKDACEVEQKIEANNRTIPGILTNRGCAYAGSKGVVFGPIKDILHITHGPIGCAYFTWGSRRNLMSEEEGRDCFCRLLPEHGRQGDGYRLWRGEEAGFSHSGSLCHLQARVHIGLLHLPHRPHRRRHRIRLPQSRGGSEDQGHSCTMRGLPRRQPIGRPPHRLQCPDGTSGRHGRAGEPWTLRRQRLRRVQHRRRLLGGQGSAGEGRLPHRQSLHRRRLLPRYRQSPPGQAEHPALPPLHQLHQPHDGREVRHPLAEGQLPGRGRHHQDPAGYGRLLRQPRSDQKDRGCDRRGDGPRPAGH